VLYAGEGISGTRESSMWRRMTSRTWSNIEHRGKTITVLRHNRQKVAEYLDELNKGLFIMGE